jgi:Domain of unknown function (DUF4268)
MDRLLGKLEKVRLRDYWEDEAANFTPWLAQEENLKLLADTIGLDLELVGTEQPVGDFSADILARDVISGGKVIIENQLERTNHDHLGKLITYASGLGAVVVVWIASEIREPHRQAITWLNEYTLESVSFFALEVELWSIGNSPAAPKFNVVSKPNTWAKISKATSDSSNISVTTETESLRLKFWTRFYEYCQEKGTSFKLRRPTSSHWYGVSVGRVGIFISLTFKVAQQVVGCELFLNNDRSKDAFMQMEAQKNEIESELGKIEWQAPEENGRRGRIAQFHKGDLGSEEAWPQLFAWLEERAEVFYKVFAPKVKALNLEVGEEA